jgi:hypothetical protein
MRHSSTRTSLKPLRRLENVLDDSVLDGMAAGFGSETRSPHSHHVPSSAYLVRTPVVLGYHLVFTSIVTMIGWALETLVSAPIGGWAGGDSDRGRAWFAYNIP